MKIRVFVFTAACAFCEKAFPQEATAGNFARKGLLKTTATVSPGFWLGHSSTNLYVGGELEYFVDNRISLRGDAFGYVGSQQKDALLKSNSKVMFGALYHVPKNKFDYFVGLQPGISFVRSSASGDAVSYPLKVSPNISVLTGITYYVFDYFNFFLDARYVHGNYNGLPGGALHLDEFILGAGLGFQLQTRKMP